MMRFDVLTLFPEMFSGVLENSIIKKAKEKNLITINIIDFRDFSTNKHHTVDDYVYGGGAGMLISVEPIHLAMQSINDINKAYKIITSPTGTVFNQNKAMELAKLDHIVIICGHYEGIDARILNYVDEEISIGDYVLTGGEVPAMAMIDAIARLIPGVISDESITQESFQQGLLEYPQYTRPPIYDNQAIPDVLLSGHHANIEKWRKMESLKKTLKNRPDLLDKVTLTSEEINMLKEIKANDKK